MSDERIIVRLCLEKQKKEYDVDIPVFLTANELVRALNTAYDLGINIIDAQECYLQAENPITLIKGNRTLKELGLRNGTVIYDTH